MKKIQILAIAPYPEFEILFKEVASEFQTIEYSTYHGFYQHAIDYLRVFPKKKFDLIISRGGTATLLKELVNIPVIDVDISVFDILNILMQAQQYSSHIAVVSYSFVTTKVNTLSKILRFPVFTYTIDDPNDLSAAMEACHEQNIELVIGGAATQSYVYNAGMQFIMLQSGRESIRSAIQHAVSRYQLISNVLQNNQIFQSIVDGSDTGIIVFNESSHICYLNTAAQDILANARSIERILHNSIPLIQENKSAKFIRCFEKDFFDIYGYLFQMNEQNHFCFTLHHLASTYRKSSISVIENYETLKQKLTCFAANSVYSLPISGRISEAALSSLPVIIQGGPGTQKNYFARRIHCESDKKASSFIKLRCEEITDKIWKQLMKNISSPLHASGYTIFFEDIDLLSPELQDSLASYMEDTLLAHRHKVICSASSDLFEKISEHHFSKRLFFSLNGITLRIPPLNQRKNDLPVLINTYISRLNTELSQSVIGLEPEAMQLLVDFDWPFNLQQLEKILRQLVSCSASYYISSAEVQVVLQNEGSESVNSSDSISLSGSLEKIEIEIIQKVLQEEHGNQSAAAKRLAISRSTLRRKLNLIE